MIMMKSVSKRTNGHEGRKKTSRLRTTQKPSKETRVTSKTSTVKRPKGKSPSRKRLAHSEEASGCDSQPKRLSTTRAVKQQEEQRAAKSGQGTVSSASGVAVKKVSVVLTRSHHLDEFCKVVTRRKSHLLRNRSLSSGCRRGRSIKRPKMSLEVDQKHSSNNGILCGVADGKSSPKKLKGTLSVKFKSWNLQKDGSQGRRAYGGANEGTEQAAFVGKKSTFPKQVVYSQDDQMLQKCDNCLLYIPVETFEQHRKNDCEALHLPGGKDYICSECLACYSSQKFLARHKRDCPKRNQNLSVQQLRYPRSAPEAGLEGMYSVVWKCHCKSNFASAEELGKHRETCVSAQQYTATCPICNVRVMGGSRTLRYHMTQNHASLFMPQETSSSSVLGGLEGTSPVGVITTQTANLNDLVKRLSREHAGANIRIVSVNPDKYKTQTKAGKPGDQVGTVQQQAAVADQDPPPAVSQMNTDTAKDSSDLQALPDHVIGSVEECSWQDKPEPGEEQIKIKTENTKDDGTRDVETTVEGTRNEAPIDGNVMTMEAGANGVGCHGDENNKDDLKDLLVKAKALTRELEEKLATEGGNGEAAPAKGTTAVEKSATRKRKLAADSEHSTTPAKKKANRSLAKSGQAPKQEAGDSKPTKLKRRFSQVTCLDCQQVFDDYVELGRHKRTDCPVVISQHLSPDGQFTEKVDMFVTGRKPRQQRPDGVECYYCTLCTSKFKLRSQVYEHMRFEHKSDGLSHYLNYHCPYCPRVFQTTRQRHAHKLERHADIKIAPEDDFTVKETEVCSVCYQVVPKWDKDKHFATGCKKDVGAEEESDTFCQLCGLLLESEEALKQHRQREHIDAIHFRCGLCSRTFGHAVELRCHKVSHHTKTPRWDRSCAVLKGQDTRMPPGTRSVKIHISPCVEEVKSPTAKARGPSPTRAPPTAGQNQDTAQTSGESTGLKMTGKAIRMPVDGSPLCLTPEQMKSLSKGQPIKLVLPKDADMKNLSFTVPGEGGKQKKYSLLPKLVGDIPGQKGRAHSKEELSKLGASLGTQATVEVEARASPQRELAAALGLQPRGNAEPAQSQHRPTRLRSGRTIEKKIGVQVIKKDKKESPVKGTGGRAKSGPCSPKSGTTDRKVGKNEGNSALRNGKGKTASKQGGCLKKKDEVKKKVTAARRARTSQRKVTRDENKNPPPSKEVAEKAGWKQGRTATKTSKENIKGLAPVQVLKPIGKDRVLCMRCNSILGSMEEVACHHCKTAK